METYGIQMKEVLRWLVRWARLVAKLLVQEILSCLGCLSLSMCLWWGAAAMQAIL